MLTGNLATRPFYNERLVTVALIVLAVAAAVLTFFNGRELVGLTRERAALAGRIDQDRTEAARINQQTASLQQSVDRGTLSTLAAATREANDLIARRTFSWSAFFSLIEKTLPFDVRLVAVSPRTERGVFRIQMGVIGRELDDFDEFTAALLATGAFKDIVPVEQRPRDDGTFFAVLEGLYQPVSSPAPAAAAAGTPATAPAAADATVTAAPRVGGPGGRGRP